MTKLLLSHDWQHELQPQLPHSFSLAGRRKAAGTWLYTSPKFWQRDCETFEKAPQGENTSRLWVDPSQKKLKSA